MLLLLFCWGRAIKATEQNHISFWRQARRSKRVAEAAAGEAQESTSRADAKEARLRVDSEAAAAPRQDAEAARNELQVTYDLLLCNQTCKHPAENQERPDASLV